MGLFRGRDISKKTTEDLYYLQEEISLEVLIVFMIEAMNFVLWISSCFWSKDPAVLSPVSTPLN